MSIVALLTGRGNNTFKNKNILPVMGHPLITYPARAAKQSKYIDEFYVSSDSLDIIETVKSFDFTMIKRPSELATADARHVDAIVHALGEIKKISNSSPDIIIVLLANSATIKAEWIDEAIETLKNDHSITAVVPAYMDQDHHPFRAKMINSDGFLDTFLDLNSIHISSNRQELVGCYFLAHNFWALRLKNGGVNMNGQKPWEFMGEKVKPLIVEESFDVHSPEDLVKTEMWLIKNNISA